MSIGLDKTWMWHPYSPEIRTDTAGHFVHFRRDLVIDSQPPPSLTIHITADTRYKLYINNHQVAFGPVKGDQSLWFYDSVDIAPHLRPGSNHIAVHVLRYFHATPYAPSFPRLPSGGLRISVPVENDSWASRIGSSSEWETAVDPSTILRVDEPEDHFLHIYERTSRQKVPALEWVPAKLLEFKNSTGNAPPWNLAPRMLPPHRVEQVFCSAVHNVQSNLPAEAWENSLFKTRCKGGLLLSAGTNHRVDIEVPHHMTAFLRFRFKRPETTGGVLRVTYSESYEDEPEDVPWTRRKGHRCDYTKSLFGPQDLYEFQGPAIDPLEYFPDEVTHETFAPFHFRTFRFLCLEIGTGPCALTLEDLSIETVNYPLDVQATFKPSTDFASSNETWDALWTTSIRSLANCMHDCYEDCPFYEQLQYGMDVRSSALFTYLLCRDDRLARQAIIQLHNSFTARNGLTGSRAPSHRPQFIPHFSLYWICMVSEHLTYFGDKKFVKQFLPVIDSVLAYFDMRIKDGLVTSEIAAGIWQFVDWTPEWKPHGIPPAISRTGISTFTNQLYAYTLSNAANLATALSRTGVADEYRARAGSIVASLRDRCYDGEYFTDTTADKAQDADYSIHCQIWAVLCGASTGSEAQTLLRSSLEHARAGKFVAESIAMSFYTMRALSLAGGTLYEDNFYQFWEPWRRQLTQGLTTWVEDDVSQRSDCHAWGSVPIYEFVVEVLGVRAEGAGVEVRPRLTLFREVEGRAPLGGGNGGAVSVVCVSWRPTQLGDVDVSVRLEAAGSVCVPVRVILPGYEVHLGDEKSECKVIIKKGGI